MLIHLGNNIFIDMDQCVAILNLATVDGDTKNRILRHFSGRLRSEARAAVLTTANTWVGSTLSPEALAHRGVCDPFPQAVYLRPEQPRKRRRQTSSERSS